MIDEIALTVAGTGGGTAAACGILGLKTRAVTTLGSDDLGDFMITKTERLRRRLRGGETGCRCADLIVDHSGAS